MKYIDPDGREDREAIGVFFYYSKSDGSQEQFEDAAQTAASEFNGRAIMIGVDSETDFKEQWNMVTAYAESNNLTIDRVEIFTHGGSDSLYFNGANDDKNDSILMASETGELAKMPFSTSAFIIMHSCNSGQSSEGIAQSMADAQGVRVAGQAGFAGFSSKLASHSFILPGSSVYLESYNRTRNNPNGNGAIMPRKLFYPRSQ